MNQSLTVPDMDLAQLGSVMAKSGFFSDIREAGQAVVKILAGRELGFGPVASMTGINIIKGRVTLSANMIAAAVKRSGRYNYRVSTLTDAVCTIEFFEGGKAIGVSTFTAEDQVKARLSGDNWDKFRRNMLFARAISNGAKWYCADVFGGPVYTPDEVGANITITEDGEMIVDVSTPPATPEPAPPPSPAPQLAKTTNDPRIQARWVELWTEAAEMGLQVRPLAFPCPDSVIVARGRELAAMIATAKNEALEGAAE